MIYDCFSFFGSEAELDLLDLKLHELSHVVDKFVISEANLTHSGKPKSLNFYQNRERFREFSSKILYISVEDMPTTPEQIRASYDKWDKSWIPDGYLTGDNWVRERYQRNQIMQALTSCQPDDIIIIEDADEIVKPSILEHIHETIVDGSNAVMQSLNTYYMNWKCLNMPWAGSKIIKYKFLSNPSECRFHTPASQILWGGWHFSYLGGGEVIRQKLLSFAHQEMAIPEILNNIETRLQNGQDALGRLYKYDVVPIDDSYPKYVRDNVSKFDKYMFKG